MTTVLIPLKKPSIRSSDIPVLNRASPQARGLTFLLSPVIAGNFSDLIGNIPFINTGMDLVVGSWGRAWSQQDDGDELDIGGAYSIGSEFTAVWILYPTAWESAGNENAGLFRTNSSGTGNTFCIIDNDDGSPWMRVGNTTVIDADAASPISLNQNHVIAYCAKSGDNAIFVDGTKTASSVTTYTPPSGGNELVHNFFWQAATSQRISGLHYEVRLYNYRVPDGIAREITGNPWDLYWRPKVMVPVKISAAEAGAQDIQGTRFNNTNEFFRGTLELEILGDAAIGAATSVTTKIRIVAPGIITKPNAVRSSGVPVINRASLQAQGLQYWWPLTLGAGNVRNFAGLPGGGRNVEGVLSGASWSVGRDGVGITFGADSDNVLFDTFTESWGYPLTIVVRCVRTAQRDYAPTFFCRGATSIFGLHETGVTENQLAFTDFASTGFDDTGPALVNNELMLCAVTASQAGAGEKNLYVITRSGGIDKVTGDIGAADITDQADQIRFGFDDVAAARVFQGTIFDIAVYFSVLPEQTIFDMSPLSQNTWDLIWHPKAMVPVTKTTTTTTDSDDVLYGGAVSTPILGSLLDDSADTLNDGDVDLIINGSLLENTNTFNSGTVNAGVIQMSGELFEDDDTLYHGSLIHLVFGSLLDSTTEIFHGVIFLGILGSLLEDVDELYHGLIIEGIVGSLFEDDDTFFDGLVSPQNIFGSLFVDPDIFYDGTISGGATPARTGVILYLNDNIVGSGAEFVDLADEITLAEQGASAEGTAHLGVEVQEDTV